jgi:hypothetical protein
MSLETDLRQALRRVPAPQGFAERVRAVILSGPSTSLGAGSDDEGSQPRRSFPFRFAALSVRVSMTAQWRRAIAATLLFGAIIGGWGAHEAIERRREGQRAREQVLLALRIAGTQVARAQREARDHMAR